MSARFITPVKGFLCNLPLAVPGIPIEDSDMSSVRGLDLLAELLTSPGSSEESGKEVAPTPIQVEAQVEQCKELIQRYDTVEEFVPGDVVIHKAGLKNKKELRPMVVYKVLDEPVIFRGKDPGSPFFREPLDMICAEVNNGILLMYHMDSHRLTHYKQEDEDK